LLENESGFKFRMYNVEKQNGHLDLKNNNSLSYSKLSSIHTSQTLEFTKNQLELIKSKNKLSWSVAVSDKSSSITNFRLLAISCISHDDMALKIENPSQKLSGFTIVFIIKDYSINKIISQFNEYSGIIKLFFKNDNANGCLLIILNVSGIYKFHFKHLNHKPTFKIQIIRYLNMEYIKACLNKHYFLADAMLEGSQYMDLYDLKTNQLVNTIQRRNLSGSGLTYRPGFFEISKNNKFLAYKFKSTRRVKLYSIECGLEAASIRIAETDETFYDYYFLHFFSDDVRLLIYRINTNEWSIWDIFGSVQKSIQLENRPEFEFNLQVEHTHTEKLKNTNSFIVTVKNNELVIYDDLISDKYLKSLKRKVNKSDLKSLSLEEIFMKKSQDKHEYFIWEFNKTSELNEYYHVIEPWLGRTGHDTGPQYSVYLDEKKRNSTSYWKMYDSNLARSYDVYVDVIKAAKEACNALIYLNKWSQMPNYDFRFNLMSTLIKANEHTLIKYILFDEKKEETLVDDSENHILKTLDYIVSEMKIKIPDSDLDSLLHEKSLHMPKCSSWEGKENEHALSVALSVDDPVFLGFLLEYYSNKATKEIGWMITVTDIIPRLYSENNKNSEVYKSYAQILFYKSCFCQKELDISSFEFLEIPPSMENSLKVFIPVTQLIPQNSVLEAKMLSQYIIPNILMSKFNPGKYAHQEDYYSPFLKLIEKIESNDPFYYNPSMEATMNVILNQSSNTYEFSNESGVDYNVTEEETDNSFSSIFSAIVAAYNWDSIPLDNWDFWPLNGKRAVLNFQRSLIFYYAFLEDSIFTTRRSEFDSKLKDKLRMRYICFYNEESITKKWVERSKEWKSNPIYVHAEGQTETESEVTIEDENIKFFGLQENRWKKQ
ncbi:7331_t:CDS:10, partial [Gigaspora margarita]